MIDVSVCISVHNTADFLPRCLDSVCAQTLKSLEIVIVNNGSTDNSEVIMRQYAANHSERKFIIVVQEDRGLSQGRQSGVNNASGRYVAFLDADDYVVPTAYEKMLHAAEQNDADIVQIQTYRENKILSSINKGLCDSHQVLKDYFEWDQSTKMLWLKLYKRELFDGKPVLSALYVNNEDGFAWPCLLYKAKNIYFLSEPLHTYSTDNEHAVMHSLFTQKALAPKLKENRKKILHIIPHIEGYIGKDVLDRDYQPYFNHLKDDILIKFLIPYVYGFSFKERVDEVKKVLGFSSYAEIKKYVKKNLPSEETNKIYRLVKLIGLRNAYYLMKIRNFLKK